MSYNYKINEINYHRFCHILLFCVHLVSLCDRHLRCVCWRSYNETSLITSAFLVKMPMFEHLIEHWHFDYLFFDEVSYGELPSRDTELV